MQRLERTERMMVRWMCGASLKDRTSSVELNNRLGVEDVTDIVRQGRLRWFGHVARKCHDDWVSNCRNFEVVKERPSVARPSVLVIARHGTACHSEF